MEATKQNPLAAAISPLFNRVLYTAFVLMAVYSFVFTPDKTQGLAPLGIALAFDPFNQQVPFGKRPVWQMAWLLTHVVIVLALFVWRMI